MGIQGEGIASGLMERRDFVRCRGVCGVAGVVIMVVKCWEEEWIEVFCW
jgi:hypothetical protein